MGNCPAKGYVNLYTNCTLRNGKNREKQGKGGNGALNGKPLEIQGFAALPRVWRMVEAGRIELPENAENSRDF
jgi:hypothetical protein